MITSILEAATAKPRRRGRPRVTEADSMRRKIEAVAEAIEAGVHPERIAAQLGVHRSTVYEWRRMVGQ